MSIQCRSTVLCVVTFPFDFLLCLEITDLIMVTKGDPIPETPEQLQMILMILKKM